MGLRERWAELPLREHAYYLREYYLRRRALWEGATPSRMPFLEGITPGRALDSGCGVGRDAVALAEKGWDVVGIDLYAPAIERARKRAPRNARFELEPATAIGEPPLEGPFDLVIDVFGPASDLSDEMRGIYASKVARVLDPRGLFAIYSFEPAERLKPIFDAFAIDRALAARYTYEPPGKGRWWLLRTK